MGQDRLLGTAKLVAVINGSPRYLGTIVATTAKDNSSTASAFTISAGSTILLQSDTACYVLAGTSADQTQPTVSATNGVYLAALEKYQFILPRATALVQAIAVTGTSNVKVWVVE